MDIVGQSGVRGFGRRAIAGALMAGAAIGALGVASPTAAQEARRPVVANARSFNIPAQSLASALIVFGDQADFQVTADTAILAGLTSQSVVGNFAPHEALSRLLAGTGLTWRVINDRAVRIERAPQVSGSTMQLGPVRVEGASAGAGSVGESAGASRRASITENTGSYTAPAVAAGAKIDAPLKDVPRSISVLSRQQLDDQRIVQFNEAMDQLGVVLAPNQGGWGNEGYSTRSYPITGITIDGTNTKNFFFGGDSSLNTGLAKFDSVQLVRGPEGLFSGEGTPGGSINLVRKRPLDDFQLKLAASAGSWNNYLGLADVSSPLNGSGSIRARAVASYNDTEKFYRNAHRKYTTLYGIVEADLSPQTTVSAGASYDRVAGTGQDIAVDFPRFSTGDPLPLDRRLGYPNYSARNSKSTNLFLEADHSFNDHWKTRLNLSYTDASGLTSAISYSSYFGGPGVDPNTGAGAEVWTPRVNSWDSKALAADFNIHGSTSIFDHDYKVVIGGDYVRTNLHNSQIATSFTYPGFDTPAWLIPIDIPAFDPTKLKMIDGQLMERNHEEQTQWGVYFYNSLQIYGPFRVIAGGRLAGNQRDNTNENVPSGNISLTRWKDDNVFIPYFAAQLDFSKQWTAYAALVRGYEDQSTLYSEDYQPLNPVRSRSIEVGLKGELLEGRLNTQFTVYQSNRRNFAVLVGTDIPFNTANPGKTCCYDGDGRFEGKGFEFDINGRLVEGLQANLGYTYDDSKIDYGANQGLRMSTNTPKHIFRAWLRYDFPTGMGMLSRLAIGGGGTARSSYYAEGSVRTWNPAGGPLGTGGFDGPSVPYKFKDPSRAIINLFAEYKLSKQWTIALNLNNVLDKTYFEFVGTTAAGNAYGAPRNFLATLRAKY